MPNAPDAPRCQNQTSRPPRHRRVQCDDWKKRFLHEPASCCCRCSFMADNRFRKRVCVPRCATQYYILCVSAVARSLDHAEEESGIRDEGASLFLCQCLQPVFPTLSSVDAGTPQAINGTFDFRQSASRGFIAVKGNWPSFQPPLAPDNSENASSSVPLNSIYLSNTL